MSTMGNNSSQSDGMPSLIKQISAVLRDEWDPIGVGESPEAAHEYDGYAQAIFGMLQKQPTRPDIFAYLWWAETENMGLDGDKQKTEQIAERLASLCSK